MLLTNLLISVALADVAPEPMGDCGCAVGGPALPLAALAVALLLPWLRRR